MPMTLSSGNQCCLNCELCHFSSDFGYYCINKDDGIHIKNPSVVVCPTYIEKQNKPKESKNMITSPFKEITVPKSVFNKEYWRVGDAYVIKAKSTKWKTLPPKIYVLEEVVETSHVLMDNGAIFSPEDFNNGHYELINHISLDQACSKSMSEE